MSENPGAPGFSFGTSRRTLSVHYKREGDRLKKNFSSLARDLWVVVLDVVAVNLSYYLALLIRFYVNFQLRPVAVNEYLPAWISFTPWYTVLSILIFAAWRLYGGMWRYAGINDMNRIIGANVCTTVLHVIGTVAFVCRMPITYYVIGAGLQFFFVTIIRFSYRLLLVEKSRFKRGERIPCLVIGTSDLGRKVIKHLEDGGAYRTVAVAGSDAGRMLDGVPVVLFSEVSEIIDEKKITELFIADPLLTSESRNEIKKIVEERGMSVQDYTGYQANMTGRIPLTALMSVSTGTVTIVKDGQKKQYENAEEVLKVVTTKMDVKKIVSPEIELGKARESGWNDWAEIYTTTTGQDVSVL